MEFSSEETLARLALFTIEGIGRRRLERLLRTFGSPSEALRANITALLAVPGMTQRLATQILERPADIPLIGEQWRSLEAAGVRAAFFSESDYPAALRNLPDMPPVLFMKGIAAEFPTRCLAIVGTREPDSEALEAATFTARRAVEKGWCVVSGLARGIDAAAHWGALNAAPTDEPLFRTIAVFGCGLESLYPREHRRLAQEISERGMLATEFLAGQVLPRWLVRRNRLISGLSKGSLLIQCGSADGTLHTARFAEKQHKPIAVWDWSEFSSPSEGTRDLCASGVPVVNRMVLDAWLENLDRNTLPGTPMILFGSERRPRRDVY